MAQASPALPAGMSLRGNAARRRRETIVRGVFLAASLVTILISVFIIETVLVEAISFLSQIDLGQLFGIGWFPRRGIFDVTTIVLGTLIVTVIAMVIATPIGLFSAIYLSEYATPRFRRTVKPVLEVLAGIPSVVLGFFALTLLTPTLIKPLFEEASSFNLAAAGLGVGILSIPLVASVAEDAMRAVPQNLREASYGLGARRRHHLHPGRVPRRDLGHRCRAHPRDQPRHRRDDGGCGGRRGAAGTDASTRSIRGAR